MNPDRMRWCLEVLGWSLSELGRRLDISDTNAANMVRGTQNIPNTVALWLETLAAAHLAYPEPYFWDANSVGDQRHAAAGEQQRRAAEMAEVAFDEPKVPASYGFGSHTMIPQFTPPTDFDSLARLIAEARASLRKLSPLRQSTDGKSLG